jgi:class 3 adenylate cyclase/tetratricopeptide (TPR) repeat protein
VGSNPTPGTACTHCTTAGIGTRGDRHAPERGRLAPSYCGVVLTCPSCGRQNPSGFAFCSACGAGLAVTATREVRKTVTVLFADVTGSTALGERLDPESLRRVMSRYFEETRQVLERHGGSVEKFIGDAVMAVFGIPRLHEDDAVRAIRAASEMRERLASLNEELERDFGVRLETRVGVNTGEVVTGEMASGERLATGDAVNVAARLEQAAQPGEIMLGEQTARLAGNAIEVAPVQPLELKGKAKPHPAYLLLRLVDGLPPFERRVDARFVGRRPELERVVAAFEGTLSDRRCRLFTILGPAGIGKSRLARELAATLQDEADVLFGRCLPYGEGITYWPLREIFAAAGSEDDLTAALAVGTPEEVFWSVRKALERQARARPLALVIEDIHWAEPTLLELVEHVAAWTRDAPILLLCLARSELLDEHPAWGGGEPRPEILTLQPLSHDESEELIEELLGGSQLELDTRVRIREVAEGNPLFVEQLLAMLAEGGEPDRVPPTIHALIASRLDGLPDEERELLERASVVGFEFEWEALGELAPDRHRPLGAHLASLVRKELIRPHEVIEDTFRFRHLLIRDAAYERIPKELRSELHERFADWLDGRGEEFEEIGGYHLEQAYRSVTELGLLGDRAQALADRAAARLAASGRRAYTRGDAPAAANLLARATAVLPSDHRLRLELAPDLGRALFEGGEMSRADSLLSEAVESARAAGERGLAADAAVALSHVRLLAAPETGAEEISRELGQAVRVFEELGDEAGLARGLGVTGTLRYWQGEAVAAGEDLERAAQYARDVGDRAQEAQSLRYVLIAIVFGPTPVAEALARIEEFRPRARGNRRFEVTLLQVSAQLEAMQGRLGSARELIAQAKALAQELGLEVVLAIGVAWVAGYVELLAGDAPAAERELRPACEALEAMGNWGNLAYLAPTLADALFLQGRDEEALELTELGERITNAWDAQPQILWRRVRAKLLARRGQGEEAELLAREATALAARTDFLEERAEAVADLAEVLRFAGRSEESAAALEEAIGLHERKGNVVAAETLRRLLAETQNIV